MGRGLFYRDVFESSHEPTLWPLCARPLRPKNRLQEMAPHASEFEVANPTQAPLSVIKLKENPSTSSRLSGPLKYSGSLDSYDKFDVMAVIGREFPSLQVTEILDDDVKIRDLAILG